MEGFYTEELLQRPEPAPPGSDVSVPDDIRSLTAGGSEYRTAAAPEFDLGALIGDLEGRR